MLEMNFAAVDSNLGRGILADVQRTFVENGAVWVEASLHLDDDHSAVKDCKGDNPEMSTDQMEWVVIVPVEHVTKWSDGLPWRTTAQARAMVNQARHKAERAARDQRVAKARAEIRRTGNRQFSELDAALRTNKPGPFSGGSYE